MKTKEQTIELLETIARLLEIKGENPFKIRAYTNAARALETFSDNFPAAVAENRIGELDGIGDAIAKKISEYVQTGALEYFEKLQAEFPETIFELFEIPGLGGKKVKALYEQLGIKTIAELEVAAKDGRVAELAGFGAKTATNLIQAIERRRKHSGRFLLSDAKIWSDELVEHFQGHPDVSQISPGGSFRRGRETIGDLDILIATKQPERIIEHFLQFEPIDRVLARGETKASVLLKCGIQADLRVVANHEFPFALGYFTGSKEHNVVLRGRALQNGWTLNEYRLAPEPGSKKVPKPIPEIQTEADLYRALGLAYIPPELRENHGEIEAAQIGELPNLIELENLRGTFHNHTSESDGHNTLREMAEAANQLGLEYLGIADHSKSSFQAHGLDEKSLLRQVEQIRELNKAFDADFQILSGIECDILRDGQLDFPDEVLAQLDYVVASVHASFTLSEKEMTKRIIRAMENRFVTILGHPTGRLLLSREPYQVDLVEIIKAAQATGTVIELNANPRRLDMDWRYWKLAKEQGVRCAINPDAHSVRGLQDLWFGIKAARKGWLTREDVINCLRLTDMQKLLRKKRDS
ncbi:MAG: DNA polymerase/3'-5' exonuclease PolX [Verrucomicrobia bacterium]|nr:DNA polymerase/3'-5' exonuclease PolX [Verrucomicrobiota bacterium]MBV8641431.1 DNA polymerase/3'-5' exonuclease PolX [Verrucomicrobiota bacterium]